MSIAVLIGWCFDIRVLKSVSPLFVTMKANTAFGILFLACAILIRTIHPRPRLARAATLILALLVMAIGGLTLIEQYGHLGFSIDQLVFQDFEHIGTPNPPGRIAPGTAVSFLLLGFGVCCCDFTLDLVTLPVLLAGLLATTALLGYAYQLESLYSVRLYVSMAVHTTGSILLLAAGLLATRAGSIFVDVFDASDEIGRSARRLIAGALIIPPLVGRLILAGQQAGWYSTEFDVALCGVMNIFLIGTLVTHTAVTLRRLRDQQLRAERDRSDAIHRYESLVNNLESAVQQRTAELEEQKQAAQDANRAKSTFLASMSHEIRTPMNAILGMAELLAESPLSDQQAQYVSVFQRAGATLLTLINDILDFSKIESGSFHLEKISFDLHAALARSIELLHPKAVAKGLSVTLEIAEETPVNVLGDPNRLQQILLNIVGNAVKFTDRGEVRVVVNPLLAGRPGEIECRVIDTGIGIEPAMMNKIFADFTQADASVTRKYGGTGLGLGIAKRLIQWMDGSIKVESEVGRGSTFRFTASFVTLDGFTPVGNESAPGDAGDLAGHRALILDDDHTNRVILREMLQAMGLEVWDFANTEEALKSFTSETRSGQPFSLLLLDSRIAEYDGFQAFARLRAVDHTIPAIMLTSDDRPGEATRCREFGIAEYAVKPVQRRELLRIVSTALRRSTVTNLSGPMPNDCDSAIGIRILVAEDSQDNRFLLERYFAETPHQITFAENGAQAVQLHRDHEFDLILMDMQMPVMDGRAAARGIRGLENQRNGARTPILALTANALTGDSKLSIEAGCDGHLTKPITKQRMMEAIRPYVPPARRLPRVEETITIQMPEGLEEIVPAYLVQRQEDARTLADLLAISDFASIQRIAHDMKGTGTSYGFEQLTQLGAAIEDAAQESNSQRLGKSVAELSAYLSRVQLN